MSSIFDNIKNYGGNWTVVKVHELDDEDRAMFKPTVTLVKSTWGFSFKFTKRVDGRYMFIPTDVAVDYIPVGTEIEISRITLVELSHPGKANILRVRVD